MRFVASIIRRFHPSRRLLKISAAALTDRQTLGSLELMQIELKRVNVVTAGKRPDGLDSHVLDREGLTGALTATRMPDDKPANVHTQWRLAVLIPLTEEEYRALAPTGLEPPYGT